MKLTDINIKNAKPGEKTRKLYDGGGLFLQIETTGGKLWRFKYRFAGKEKLLALGKYPDVGLQEARKRHREAREHVAQGIDPSALKKALKATGKERAANSFEVVAWEWFEIWKDDKVESHIANTLARLKKDVFPYIGGKPVAEITAPDVLAVCRRVESRGAINTAHLAKQAISQIMRYAIATGRADRDPCPDLRGALKVIQVKNMPTFTEPEQVAELLRAIEIYRGTPVVRSALHLMPLVFCRPGELRRMKWADIDFDRAEWKYVVSKTRKTGVAEHIVPLSRQAMEILKDLEPLTGSGVFVFPHASEKRLPMGPTSLNRALQAMGYDTKTEITGHGFRAMARTMLAERLKMPPEVIEHQLAHKVPDALGTAYNRTKFYDDRRRMMSAWADYLDGLRTRTDI